MEFLTDRAFLREVNAHRVAEYFARIEILDFATEHTLTSLEGKVTAGSININTSNVRRSGSLNVVFDSDTFDLSNPDNLIAINKKVKIHIGINNPFYEISPVPAWSDYPKILWFLQGVFILTMAGTSVGPTSSSVSVNFIDKMGMLNGTCGGVIPASISLHDRLTIDGDGNVTVDYPRIRQIIFEVVHHFGGEHPGKIVINDIPDFGRRVVRYSGSTPIWFAERPVNTPGPGGFRISPYFDPNFPNRFTQGDDIGYMSSELIFPGEFVKSAGATVEGILDTIANTLGNYEFFYDVDGTFIFQQVRFFERTGEAPLSTEIGMNSPFNIDPSLDAPFQNGYLPQFNDDQFINEFMNNDLVNSINYNPQLGMIKNDFIVWGTRQRDGEDSRVWMHLAVDEKPRRVYFEYDPEDDDENHIYNSLSYQWIWERRREDNTILRYEFSHTVDNMTHAPSDVPATGTHPANKIFAFVGDDLIGRNPDGETIRLHSPSLNASGTGRNNHAGVRTTSIAYNLNFEWREELYRRALRAFADAEVGSDYDAELMWEWRRIYDPNNDGFAIRWREQFRRTSPPFPSTLVSDPPWQGYRREIITDPSEIHYWLDIIDTNSALGNFSVNRIGRRSMVVEDSQIHEVLNRQVPSIVFIDGRLPFEERQEAMNEQVAIGQAFMFVQPHYMPLFQFRNSFGSCYEVIRDMLHVHLIHNASVTVNSKPIFYLDVNRVIRLNFPEQGVVGNFIINRMSWNLGDNPRMSLTANEAITIV